MLDRFQESTFLLETFNKLANAWVIGAKHGVVEQFSSTGQLATFGLADLAIGANTNVLLTVDLNSTITQLSHRGSHSYNGQVKYECDWEL